METGLSFADQNLIKAYEGAIICDFRTHERFPGIVYASIKSASGEVLVSASLAYCAGRIQSVMDMKEGK